MKIEGFRDGILKIDGQAMTIADAFSSYPKDTRKIYTFVNKSLREMEHQDKLIHQENTIKIKAIKDKTIEILKNLDLKNDDNYIKFYKIFKYIVLSSHYDENILKEKQEIYNKNISPMGKSNTLEIEAIYKCLIENRSDCLGDSIAMSFLLRCLGYDATYITIGNKNMQDIHAVVQINFYGEKFYCEPTTFREAIKLGIMNLSDEKFLLTEEFYKDYLKENKLKILYVYQPIEFLENGEKMKFEEEKE